RGLGGDDVDLRHRLDNFHRDRSRRADDARAMVKRWAETAGGRAIDNERSPGALLALAYPDRIASNRRGGNVDPASPLAREPYLAVAELTGAAAASRIVLAAPIILDEIETRFSDQIVMHEATTFETVSASLRARRSRRFGAFALGEQTLQVTPGTDSARLLAEGIAGLGISR